MALHTKVSKQKKTQIDKALENFLPRGINLLKLKTPSVSEYDDLLKATEVEEFSLNFKTFLGKVSKVTDGDSLQIFIKLLGQLTRFNFRLNGVDTP